MGAFDGIGFWEGLYKLGRTTVQCSFLGPPTRYVEFRVEGAANASAVDNILRTALRDADWRDCDEPLPTWYTHVQRLPEARKIYLSLGVAPLPIEEHLFSGVETRREHDYTSVAMRFWPSLIMRLEPSVFNDAVDRLAVLVEADFRRRGLRWQRRN